MKRKLLLVCATGLLVALSRAPAATLYVDAASTNAVPPFSTWATAAAVIQDALDAALDGDTVLVTNGVYATGGRPASEMDLNNRVCIDRAITLRSVNGPGSTLIDGMASGRCAYLTNGAVLAGFTLTNGTTQFDGDVFNLFPDSSGGGAWCEGIDAVLSNCVVVGCWALEFGGGTFSGTLKDCVLMGNRADNGGGGASGSTLYNCLVTGNTGSGVLWSTLNNCVLTDNRGGVGGGANRSLLTNCIVSGNSAYEVGGGAYESTLYNCTLTGNEASDYGGGAFVCTLYNCTVTSNRSYYFGGGATRCTLNNCTITGNLAGSEDDFGGGGGTSDCALNNCIVYHNISYSIGDNDVGSVLNYSCTTPTPTSGVGNITNAPLFVDTNGWSNLRLQSNSPCINAGNNAYVATATDLDGNPRIAGGTVDMGAYEFQSPASTISYAWLQQSGLNTDGSADHVDTDHDGHNNWQEWKAGTDPINALSMLWLASPVTTLTNVTFTWTSVANRTYILEQATNMAGAPVFSVLCSNLAGMPGTTSWTDTNAPISSPRFYRLRVSP